MTVWFVRRREDNTIASAHQRAMPGYAEEALDDSVSVELQTHRQSATDPVPPAVRSGQLILALHELQFLDAVEAAVAQMPRLAQALWARASLFDRDNDLLVAAAQMAGMTSADVDAVFRLAAAK